MQNRVQYSEAILPQTVASDDEDKASPNRNLLLVTYSFPPFGGVGVHRALSLARYLPENGWNVHVLTARNPSSVGRDAELLRLIPKKVAVHRIPTLDLPFAIKKTIKRVIGGGQGTPQPAATPGTRQNSPSLKSRLMQAFMELLTPDPQVLWLPFAIPAAAWIVRRYGIGTVIVTVPPYSSLRIGVRLKQLFPKLSLFSDFRDEWLTYYLDTLALNRSTRARARAAEIERDVVEHSTAVIAVTERARVEMRNRYPHQPEQKFCLVTNGYDAEAFRSFKATENRSGKVLFCYAGTVYAPADPTNFATALALLPDDVKARMMIRFIGYIENPVHRQMLEAESTCVRLEGFLPQKQALGELQAADFLLLIWNDVINIPGKLFDYLGTGKPIVAFTPPESEVWRIIAQTRSGWCADSRNPDEIAALLKRACADTALMRADFVPDATTIRGYERRERAAQYAALISRAQ
jgi:glycosyltransferase involved in cell wall biosynthesis